MTISEVRINKIDGKGMLKGYASVTFDKMLVVNGFAIMDGKNGIFVNNPSTKGKDGKYYDSVFTLTKESRNALHNRIIEEYNKSEPEEVPFK